MNKFLTLAIACLITATCLAQTGTVPASKSLTRVGTLTRVGNKYYAGNQEMNKRQTLDFLAQKNCQAAYQEFRKGYGTATAGWVMLGVGLALDFGYVACVCVSAVELAKDTPNEKKAANIATAGLAMGLTGAVLELASIPTLIVGYTKMHRAADVYNLDCTKSTAYNPYWAVQASDNGIGLALHF